uniref:Predicted protein n=1 Tax=Hordeum vulgare subsp. vulgare TaxID=112509 RepID=F2DPX4_HORVV|nr:predicted protein [Hordeum vulgare subsp. vulgare]
MAMASLAAPSPACCSLQFHLLRRPALVLLLPRLRIPLRLRLRAQAAPSPSPEPEPEADDSFAGWSDKQQDNKEEDAADSDSHSGGGLVGPALAGLLFLAGITFAAISFTSTNNNASKAPIQSLPAHNSTQHDTPDQQHNEAAATQSQVLSPADDTPDATSEPTTPSLPNNLQTTQMQAENDMEISTTSDLDPTTDKYIASNDATPVSDSAESLLAAYDSSGKLGAAQPHSEDTTPHLPEELLDSQASLPENQDILTSDIMVLDSGDVVQLSDTHSQDNEQNPQLSTQDGAPASTFPDYVPYDSTDQMLPSGSNDLPTEDANQGRVKQASASDQDQGQNYLDNQNDLFKSAAHGKSFSPGIPAPSLLSAALQVPAGQIVVPAAVDPTQGNALAALQVLKVIEPGALPGDLCTRREYARWLVVASNSLSRNTYSKVYPAMYIENVSELAFDDVTTEDPDFPFIQGLAEAGLISSKLSRSDMDIDENVQNNHYFFSPESPLSRQDLVSWKMALDKRQLPEVEKFSVQDIWLHRH